MQQRLHALIAPRERLCASFLQAWSQLPKTDQPALDAWAAAAVALIEVNAGAASQLAFWSASASRAGSMTDLAASGQAAARICRHAGARATLACLQALPAVLVMLDSGEQHLWWQGLQRLACEAPDCVAAACEHVQALLADRTGKTFTNIVAVGLKAYRHDKIRCLAFFALHDRWARTLLIRAPDVPGFETLSRMLCAFSVALWDDFVTLRAAPLSESHSPRASLAGHVVLMPAAVHAETPAAATRLYAATVTHASAHLAHPPVRRPMGELKPLQIALITLIEDARIEALAIRRYPGLRNLWGPFHVAPASGPRTATNLMARLSRALFDPAHPDPDGFVAKGRALFSGEASATLDDPDLSLRVGRRLGHDLGQMRVQFNWRDHVIEPAYRDDGGHLWEAPDQVAEAFDLLVQAGRASPGQVPATGQRSPGAAAAGRARETPSGEQGTVIAHYPEWDASCGVERPDWTILRDVPVRRADPAGLRAAMHGQAALRARIARLVRASTIGQPVRLKRQPDGDDLDMDSAVDATIALRAGHAPDLRLFRRTRPRSRDLATVLLLDTSASTAARLADGRSVLDVQRLAVALLGEALDGRGDRFALRAFASNGRHDVRLSRIKEFSDRFDDAALSGLAGLRPELSTRLGAALRHARAEFAASRAWRRLLLVLTDGEPSDIDVADCQELVVDARRAVFGLKQSGIDVFGVVLDPSGVGSASAIFGRSNTIAIRNLADLPARLAGLYFRLARR